MTQKGRNLVVFLTLLVCASGCVKAVEDRGFVIDKADFDKLSKGMTKDDVRRKVGSPSSISDLGGDIWYYIGVKQEKSAFSSPDIIKKSIVKIAFDDKGNMIEVTTNSETDQREIDFAKDETPTEGNKVGVLEQLLGNVGRFNAPKEAE